MKKLFATIALLSLTVFMGDASAQTISIINLDDKVQEFHTGNFETPHKVTLQPGEKWTAYGYPVYVLYNDYRRELERHSEYAIWPGNLLAKQRYFNKL